MDIKELVAQIQANKVVETAKEESKEAKVWLNVGANITIDGVSTFISLPLGIPMDTMKPAKGTGTYSQAKNSLLASIMQMAEGVQPGEGKTLTGLDVQIYHRSEKQESVAAPEAFNLSFK